MRDKQPDPHNRSNHPQLTMGKIRKRRRRRGTRQKLRAWAADWTPDRR